MAVFQRVFWSHMPRTSVKNPVTSISVVSSPKLKFLIFFRLYDHVYRKCTVGYQTKHRTSFREESENRIQRWSLGGSNFGKCLQCSLSILFYFIWSRRYRCVIWMKTTNLTLRLYFTFSKEPLLHMYFCAPRIRDFCQCFALGVFSLAYFRVKTFRYCQLFVQTKERYR